MLKLDKKPALKVEKQSNLKKIRDIYNLATNLPKWNVLNLGQESLEHVCEDIMGTYILAHKWENEHLDVLNIWMIPAAGLLANQSEHNQSWKGTASRDCAKFSHRTTTALLKRICWVCHLLLRGMLPQQNPFQMDLNLHGRHIWLIHWWP